MAVCKGRARLMRGGGFLLSAAAAVALGLSAFAAPALGAESSAMSDFRRFCIATGGDAAKVKAAAEQAGWTEVPGDALGDEDDVTIEVAFMSADGGLKLLAVMRGEVQPGLNGKGCALAVDPSKAASLAEELAALARVKRHTGIDAEDIVFIYSDTASGRRDLSGQTEAQILEMSKAAPVQGLFLSEQDEMTMVAVVDIGAE